MSVIERAAYGDLLCLLKQQNAMKLMLMWPLVLCQQPVGGFVILAKHPPWMSSLSSQQCSFRRAVYATAGPAVVPARETTSTATMSFWDAIQGGGGGGAGAGEIAASSLSNEKAKEKCPVLICPAQLSVPGDYRNMIAELNDRYGACDGFVPRSVMSVTRGECLRMTCCLLYHATSILCLLLIHWL